MAEPTILEGATRTNPQGQTETYTPEGTWATSPTATTPPVTTSPDQNLENIRKVFGQQWTPSPTFTPEMQKQGVYGAVRIAGTPQVWTIGTGGKPLSAEEYQKQFGTSAQQGIVGEVTEDQARRLGIVLAGKEPIVGEPEKPFITDSETVVKEENDLTKQLQDMKTSMDESNIRFKALEDDLQKQTDAQLTELEKRRKEEIEAINQQFNILAGEQAEAQKKEVGTQTTVLARIGGFLGQSASSQGAINNLAATHRQQQTILEAKRASAINEANAAITNKQFELARQKITDARDTETEMNKRRNEFFDNTMSIIQEQRQQSEEDRVQKKAIFDDAIANIEAVMPDYTDQLTGKTRAEVEDFMFTKAKELRVDPNLLIGKYYAALQKEKVAPKTLGTPDTGVWEYNEKTGEWLNVIPARKPINTMTATERLTGAKSAALSEASKSFKEHMQSLAQRDPNWDGYIDPDEYQRVKEEFVSIFADPSLFDNVFSSKLSPKERAELGVGKYATKAPLGTTEGGIPGFEDL